MLEQQLEVHEYSINNYKITFSFTLSTTYDGVTETNSDTYTISFDSSSAVDPVISIIENSSEISELKQTCANALMGIPLELPEGYGGE